jgi:PadR family transcriptional regulator PadR
LLLTDYIAGVVEVNFNSIGSDVLRGYIDLMILRVLCDGDSYGYEISKRITTLSGGGYSMKETTLYSAFSRLGKLGYLRSYPGTYSGGRERTYYSLTDEGRRHYHNKCDEWVLTKDLIKNFIMNIEKQKE